MTRNELLARLHGLARASGLDDVTYRDKLERLTGKRSAKELTDAELETAVDAFHVKQKANNPHTAKVKALWIAAYNLGAFERGHDAALDVFVKKQTGKESLAFVTPSESVRLVEALKAICEREGFLVPASDRGGLEPRRALLRAQWAKLAKLGAVAIADDAALDRYVTKRFLTFTGSVVHLTAAQLDAQARGFGAWIRSTQGNAS